MSSKSGPLDWKNEQKYLLKQGNGTPFKLCQTNHQLIKFKDLPPAGNELSNQVKTESKHFVAPVIRMRGGSLVFILSNMSKHNFRTSPTLSCVKEPGKNSTK